MMMMMIMKNKKGLFLKFCHIRIFIQMSIVVARVGKVSKNEIMGINNINQKILKCKVSFKYKYKWAWLLIPIIYIYKSA